MLHNVFLNTLLHNVDHDLDIQKRAMDIGRLLSTWEK